MLNFIVNGRSGMGKGNKNLKILIDYCYDKQLPYTVHITGAPDHARTISADLSRSHPDSPIIAVGGDGTFHEVLNGVVDPKTTPVGFIPSGRGNDYARAANLSLNPIKALEAIIRNETVYTDYIQVGDKRCLNIAGTGLDIDVLERVAGRPGKISYLLSLLHCLKNFEPYKVKVTHGGESHDYDCVMVGVCNGVAIGGGLRLSPRSKIDDGKFNVVIIEMPKEGGLMKVLPKFKKGNHIDMEITTTYLADEIEVLSYSGKPVQLDGEIYRDITLSCRMVAGGLKTFKLD